MKNIYFILLLSCFTASLSFAQNTIRLFGTVYDEDTKEGIPFCNVYVQGTSNGTTTDINGEYSIEVERSNKPDTLVASSLGYNLDKKAIQYQLTEQNISFRLTSGAYSLGTIEVLAGENPANIIVRKIIKNKPQNDKERFDSYQTEMYSKMELDLDDIDAELRNRPIFKKFQFIFDNVDSTSDEKPFLPAYLAERMYDVYFLKGSGRKEMLKAQQVSGIRNNSVVDFINGLNENYNVYDNWMAMLGKEFVSPFSDQGLGYYEYYILDSTYIQNRWCYKLKFKPKRIQEPTFFGDFWVDMSSYGIVIANMRMSPDVNINFVERIILYYECELDSLQRWLPSKEKTVVDFKGRRPETQQEISMVARKTLCYRNFNVNDPATAALYKQQDPEEVRPELLYQDSTFWGQNRFEALSTHEASVYSMIDSIQKVPVYKTFAELINVLATGYVVLGPVEIGQYWDILTFNEIEQLRLGIGIGTSTRWLGKDNPYSKKIRFYGYLGYGLRDEKLKYNGIFEYVFNKYRRTEIGIEYTDWVTYESRSSEQQSTQSLFAGMFRREAPQKLLHVREAKIYYQHGWKHGFRNRLVLMHRTLSPYGYQDAHMGGFNFQFIPDPARPQHITRSITTAEIIFSTRFAYKEKILTGNFSDISIGTKYPIIELKYIAGIKGIVGSEFNYHKLSLDIRHWFYIRPVGWLWYNIEVGRVFGKRLPYLLLEVHPGNEGYFYNRAAFNGMNSYEFVSDAYVSFRFEHHWDGFFLNRIPLLRKLKWREVVSLRGVWGTMSAANRQANQLNNYDRHYRAFNPNYPEGPFYGSFDKCPYLECAVGIENIFKVFRVDALWRLTYLRNRYASKFSIRMTLNFNF